MLLIRAGWNTSHQIHRDFIIWLSSEPKAFNKKSQFWQCFWRKGFFDPGWTLQLFPETGVRLLKASKRFIFDLMKKKRLKPKRLLCYTIIIVQPVLSLLTQNTLGRRTLVLSKESASSRKAMEMKLLGRVFSNCQLTHSEWAKGLGLTYQLRLKHELLPDYLKLHLQLPSIYIFLSFIFPSPGSTSRIYNLHNSTYTT